jgi:hypothetical protein
MNELKGYTIQELIAFAGAGIAVMQSNQAKKDNYQRLCEKYYETRCAKIGAKLTRLEKELGYSSYIELLL